MSNMSQRFGIASLDEARAYLSHDALGPRLLESMEILDRLEGRSAREIFGDVDAEKFQSCLTLFAHARATDQADRHFQSRDDCPSIFERLLGKYFAGQADHRTELLLCADR